MKPLALSTMFAQQDRFADGAEFARFAAASGYDAIEISHSTRADKLQQIIDCRTLPITSVHQPAPWVQHADGRGNSKCNLASTDRIERVCAIDYARETINWAAKLGAKRIVVHLGAVTEEAMFQEEYDMRRMFDSGRAEDPRFAELREAAIGRRTEAAAPYVAAAKASLQELVRVAEPHGIAIENRYHFHEIPLPHEYDIVLEGLAPDQAGYWHDTGHAEVLHRLGFIDRHAWFAANQGRIIGAHLHDVLGIGDHRAPGDGDVDWAYITEGLKHLPSYTLEINQHQPDELVAATPAFLDRMGLR